jgi:MFS family permease
MHRISTIPGPQRLLATSIVARLPTEMLGVGLLVHARHLTGSFTRAGVVTGAFAIALGAGGPLLGRIVDRRGRTAVLLGGACVASVLLFAIALLPAHAPIATLVALAAGIGLTMPPIGACLRTQLPALLSDPGALRRTYAMEASLVELTYIVGPALAVGIGAVWSTPMAIALAGVFLLTGTAAFAAQPESRSWGAPRAVRPVPTGALRVPAMRVLVAILVAVGLLLGADEVAVVAAATRLHAPVGAAGLFAVWGTGSFLGGLAISRLGGGARTATGCGLLLAAMTAGHLALIPADGSLVLLMVVLFLAGATIAPTEASLYAMVNSAVQPGALTEAFAWLATAMALGGAAGAAGAGAVVDRAGPAAAFALAGVAGALAVLTVLLCSRWLAPGRNRRPHLGSAPGRSGSGLRRQTAVAVPGVVGVTVLGWFAWTHLFGVRLVAVQSHGGVGPVTGVSVVIAAAGACLAATVARWLLTRRSPDDGLRSWDRLCLGMAIVSLGGPLTLAVGAIGKVALVSLHLLCAAAILAFLRPVRSDRPTAPVPDRRPDAGPDAGLDAGPDAGPDGGSRGPREAGEVESGPLGCLMRTGAAATTDVR